MCRPQVEALERTNARLRLERDLLHAQVSLILTRRHRREAQLLRQQERLKRSSYAEIKA